MRVGTGDNSDTRTEDPPGRSGGLNRRANILYALAPCSTNMYTPPYLSSKHREAQQKPIKAADSTPDAGCVVQRCLLRQMSVIWPCVRRYIAAFLILD